MRRRYSPAGGLSLVAQQTPVRDNAQQRDATATPTGTASIPGIVVNDETPGRPVRRAAVTLTGGVLTAGRTEDGRRRQV